MSNENSSADYPATQGSAAIGARLRRLSERIDREVGQLYARQNVPFEQRWYGPFNQIRLHGPISIGEVARNLGVSHAAISQTCAALIAADLIGIAADPSDARRRNMLLTRAGRELARRMASFWEQLDALSRELDVAAGGLVARIDQLEKALGDEDLTTRFTRLASPPTRSDVND